MLTTGRLIGIAASALVLVASPVLAQGKGKGHDKGHKDKDNDKHDRVVVVESNGNINRVPPGLAKKPGQMPPGQYKKRYTTVQGVGVLREVFVRNGYTVVRTTPYNTGQYVYYRAPNGTVQRAYITPGTEQLGFNNVPALILQQVLARLY